MASTLKGSIKVMSGIHEDEQVSSFQNACLSSAPGGQACSIAIYPSYPDKVVTEKETREYLSQKLQPLIEQGWVFEIQLGDAAS